jgi:hypothetical protein
MGIDTALEQRIFNLTERQRIADVHHHRQADDLGRTVEIAEGILQPPKLWILTSRLKTGCSDNAPVSWLRSRS